MFQDRFGYNEKIPEDIREIFFWLCQDLASLQSEWDFYSVLYSNDENTTLLSDVARLSFNIIEESCRDSMTMAISRLSDPPKTSGKENLSIPTLVNKCQYIECLQPLLAEFQTACAPIGKLRNKRVGHRDLKAVIDPSENPIPGVNKDQIEHILSLAARILNIVEQHYCDAELNFHTIGVGDANDLLYYLRAGQEKEIERRTFVSIQLGGPNQSGD